MKEVRVKIDETLCAMIQDRHLRAEAAQGTLNRLLANGVTIEPSALKTVLDTIIEIETEKQTLLNQIESQYGPKGRVSFTVEFESKEAVFVCND